MNEKTAFRYDLWYDPVEGFWLDLRDGRVRLGFSPLVQEGTGAFVSLMLAEPGSELQRGDTLGSVEAEKHVGHLKAPLSGRVLAVNEAVLENPRLANLDPYGAWLVELEPSRLDEEADQLVFGEETVRAWYEAELKKYKDKGWLAEP